MVRVEVAPGVSLAGGIAGDGAEDVLLVHGWMTASASMRPLAQRIAATRRTAWVDLRGTGQSDTPHAGYDLQRQADDLAAWIEGAGLRRPAVVAHSMGGQIAQILAARHPMHVRRLVLLNPVPAAGLALPPQVHQLFASSAGSRELQGQILDMACTQLTSRVRSELLEVAATASTASITQGLEAWTAGGFAEALGAVRVPTHVVATSDPFLPPSLLKQAVVERISGAALHLLEGPGHYPHAEALDRTAALVDALLAA